MNTTEIIITINRSRKQGGTARARLFIALAAAILCLAAFMGCGSGLFGPPHLKERPASCAANLRNIGTAVEMYQSDKGKYPAALNELLPGYLKKIPACSSAGRDTYTGSYRYSYDTEPERQNFTVFCEGAYHITYTRQANLPLYSKKMGVRTVQEGTAGVDPTQRKKDICNENIGSIRNALERYAADHGGAYPQSLQGLVPRYLPSIPVCLRAGAHGMDSYSGGYKVTTEGTGGKKSSYTLFCTYCSGGI